MVMVLWRLGKTGPGLNPSHPGCWKTRFNKQKFSALLECAILVLKACYLYDNWCQALFIGLNARPFRGRFPKLFFPALRAGLFFFFPKKIEQKLQDSSNKISPATVSRGRTYDQKTRKTLGTGTLIALVLAIPAGKGLTKAREAELPFLVEDGDTQESSPHAHPGACSMPRESSQAAVGLHSLPGYQVKAEITHHIFLFPVVPTEPYHEVFLSRLTCHRARCCWELFWFLEQS